MPGRGTRLGFGTVGGALVCVAEAWFTSVWSKFRGLSCDLTGLFGVCGAVSMGLESVISL